MRAKDANSDWLYGFGHTDGVAATGQGIEDLSGCASSLTKIGGLLRRTERFLYSINDSFR